MTAPINALGLSHRPALLDLLSRVKEFDREDVAVAVELMEIYLKDSTQTDYLFRVALDVDDHLQGFICYGPTPLTEGTWDLYWIAVDPDLKGRGVGSLLMGSMEEDIRRRKGRLLIIETSSSPEYELTRRFYLRNGCFVAETIPDFYRPGEDRVTFLKRV